MIVIESPRSRRHVAAEAALSALAGAGVQLAAGASALAHELAAGPVSGSRVASSGLQLAMQATGEVVAVSDDDIRAINDRHSSEALSADDVVVLQDFALSNARISDRPIQFTTAALHKLAACAAGGRTVCFNHDWSDVIGATFAADVTDATVREVEATWLRLRWYGVVNADTSPERRQRLQDCRTGTLRFGSVGVWGGNWEFVEVEGPDGFDYFYLVDDADDLELREYSRVYFGASAGAGDAKFRASGRPSSPPAPTSGASPKVLCVL